MRTRRARTHIAAVLVIGLAVAGCSTKSQDKSSTGAGKGAVKTDKGVTDTEITLGVLTDLTGQFAALGKGIGQGNKLYWDEKNAAGGVCGRKVSLLIKDHGYNVQNAVSLYAQIKDQVLGLEQSLGSPMTTALSPSIQQDKLLTAPASWASSLLDNPYIQITGTTYDLEIVNGVDYLVKEGKLKKGDKVGYIYQEGEYGENGLAGGKYAAEKNGLSLVEQKIKPTDTDMTAQVSAIKASGAPVILITSGPKQSASAASVAKAIGYNVTILSSNPGYSPSLLTGVAKDALESTFLVVQSGAPFSAPGAAVAKVRDAFKKAFPGETPQASVMYGYAVAEVYGKILDKACANKDLTRDGVEKAFRSMTNIDTDGLVAPLDYSKPGVSPSREVYIVKPDSTQEGGQKVVRDLFASDNAKSFTRAKA